jgi:hypothetical protein
VAHFHDDGSFSDKVVFTPGYGEFYSAHEGDVEALALAVLTDALSGPLPRELRIISAGAQDIFDLALEKKWGPSRQRLRRWLPHGSPFRRAKYPRGSWARPPAVCGPYSLRWIHVAR